MTPYLWRLCCVSLASLFVVQLGAGLMLRLSAARVVGLAGRFEPARAAALMLALRWLPGLCGLFVAVCVCAPSYLRLEPLESAEEMGVLCVTLAGLGLLSYLIPLGRTAFRVVRSEFRLRVLLRDAEERAGGVCVIRRPAPAMALVGLFGSRVLVSREVMALLSADQMEAALRHERAHRDSGDNGKRLLLEMAPIDAGGVALRAAWSRFTEWAADDRATEGDSSRSVALASALVSVARLASVPECGPAASLLVSDGPGLRARVERLLEPLERAPLRLWRVAAGVGVFAIVIAAAAQQPAVAAFVHRLTEALVD